MRTQFFIYLSVFALAAFLLSSVIAFTTVTISARNEVKQTIKAKIEESYAQSRRARFTQFELKNRVGYHAITLANAVAVALSSNKALLEFDPEASDRKEGGLGLLCSLFDLTEISVADDKGIVIASFPSKYVGCDYDEEPLNEFLNLLTEPDKPIVQDFRKNADDPTNEEFLYCGVKRFDAPGFIEIGLRAKPLQQIYDLGQVAHFITPYIGVNGCFAVFHDNKCIGGNKMLYDLNYSQIKLNHVESHTIDGNKYLVYTQEVDDELYVGAILRSSLLAERVVALATLVFTNFVLFIGVFLGISVLVKHNIVDSVGKINSSLQKITNGDLDERVRARVSKEFAELSDGVNTTVDSLKTAIQEVQRRAEEELSLAQRIQEAALPKLEDAYARETAFDVFAINRPMHKVGGDMYDFFYLDDTRLIFYVADVSGHGVAASLVMMKTMALVKNLALSGLDLTEVVSRANDYLAENNSLMFVTGFFCMFDLSTGILTYVNAGHNPPFMRKAGKKFEPISPEINLILGVVPGTKYESAQFKMYLGDVFMLYTDGITEATAPGLDCFEISRALDALNGVEKGATSKEMTRTLLDAVDRFTGGAEPSDDETVLMFKFKQFITDDEDYKGE